MFNAVIDAAASWRGILHVSEWTGLSLGALASIALLVYLDPRVLKPAILLAIGLLLLYGGTLYGDHTGRADVEAQWADAREAAIKADQERDTMIEQKLEAKYQPQLAALQKLADERNARAAANERKIATNSKAPARGACLLGAAANRVPAKR